MIFWWMIGCFSTEQEGLRPRPSALGFQGCRDVTKTDILGEGILGYFLVLLDLTRWWNFAKIKIKPR